MADYIVIFGAAVREDGSASGTLRRRCENAARYGLAPGRADFDPYFLATGGVGGHGPAEAEVMRDLLLQLGVREERIVLERRARDTLQSVLNCAAVLRRRGFAGQLVVSTSSYHRFRCVLLFVLAGFRCRALPTRSDRPYVGLPKWAGYATKEFIATPWDAMCVLMWRARRSMAA